jgi:hypothetical protein
MEGGTGMTKEQALERARRGAAFLDEKLGRGWRRRIRRRRLDMACGSFDPDVPSECGCIIAQLSPTHHYADVYDLVGVEVFTDEAVQLGLTLGFDGVGVSYEDAKWALLTEAWREVLREKPALA